MEDTIEGNDTMWKAYLIDPQHPELCEFIKRVEPLIKEDIDRSTEHILRGNLDQAWSFLKKA